VASEERSQAVAQRERNLVAQLRNGDCSGLGELIDMHGDNLLHYLIALLGDRTAAEDVFQDVWIRVIERIHRFRAGRPLAPWLFRVARNRAYDVLRRERLRSPRLPVAAAPDPTAALSSEDRIDSRIAAGDLAAKLLGALPAKHREVLWLRFYAELSYDEIAAVCRVPLGTVKSRLRRALTNGAETCRRLEATHARP